MRYARVPHEVTAEILTAPWTWSTSNGDTATAEARDYRLTDPATGAEWSITPGAFAESYRHLHGPTFVSRGDVVARRLTHGEPSTDVVTLEGLERALPGDWVVTDDHGNDWVVQDAWFRSRYRAVTDPVGRA